MTDEEKAGTAHLVIGRLLRLVSRPFQEGDVAEYSALRALLLSVSPEPTDDTPNWVRDRLKGAQGDP